MKEIRILRLDYNGQELVLSFDLETPIRPETLVLWAQRDRRVRLAPGDRLKFRVGSLDPASRIKQCMELLSELGGNNLSRTADLNQ